MEALDLAVITEAWIRLFELDSLFYLFLGTLIGLVFGVLPRLGGTTALAILIPFSMNMEPGDAIILMAGVMGVAPTSGAVTAILLNTPGNGAQRRHDAGRISAVSTRKGGTGHRGCGGGIRAGRNHRNNFPDSYGTHYP